MQALEVLPTEEFGGETTVTIRGVDRDIWLRFKARAALRDENLGEPATRAFRYLLEREPEAA